MRQLRPIQSQQEERQEASKRKSNATVEAHSEPAGGKEERQECNNRGPPEGLGRKGTSAGPIASHCQHPSVSALCISTLRTFKSHHGKGMLMLGLTEFQGEQAPETSLLSIESNVGRSAGGRYEAC